MLPRDQFKKYRIQIGTDELGESKVLSLIAEDPESPVIANTDKAEKKLQEVLKETRVRIGSLL